MNDRWRHKAALGIAILSLMLLAVALLNGCDAPAAQNAATPTTVMATGKELAGLGCVCHIQGEKGAPPVSEVAALPESEITHTVRQGPGAMPSWNTQNLSDQLLADIVSYLKSAPQGTPGAATP